MNVSSEIHIGFITSHYPFPNSKSVGGIGASIKNLAQELNKLGHKVSVFVYGQTLDEKVQLDNIDVYTIKNIKFKGLSWFLTRKKIQRVINEVSKIEKIDIVEAPDWEGITSFIKLQCPIVIRLHGSDAYFCFLEKSNAKNWNKYQEYKSLIKADGIISVSKFTGDLTNEIFKINKEFKVIHNGVDVGKFTPIAETCDTQIVLYFGGIIRKKGLLEIPHFFNRVVAACPKAELILIGKDMVDVFSGNYSTIQLMEKIYSDAAKKNVRFLGSVPYQEISNYIANATVCVFPSYAEALPVSWIEAMASGKALVTSNIGWSNEIIEEGINGFKVSPSNHDAFASKIILLLKNEELRKNIQRGARQTVLEKFSTEITAKQTLEFYNEIISKNND